MASAMRHVRTTAEETMAMTSPDISILSVATALPGPPIDNITLARRFGMGEAWTNWVDTFVGTKNRHYAVDLETGETRHTLADLGVEVGERALESAGMTADQIDLIVLATASPDQLMPATVNVVADRLGVDGVPSFQLQSGCTGAVQALKLAQQMLLSGACRTALVLGGDVSYKHLDPDADITAALPAQLVNLVLFGDGVGGAVLSTEPAPGSTTLHDVLLRLTGRGRPPGQTVQWYGVGRRPEGPAASEDYKAIEASVPTMAAEVLQELYEGQGWKESDLDFILPPQLSGRMTKRIMEHLAVDGPEEVTCVHEIGNNGNGLVFFQLEKALNRMEPGQRALAVAIEASKWIRGGLALEKV
jgi:3-oxoacyl-[acyl-carrier-protein] synthase-3